MRKTSVQSKVRRDPQMPKRVLIDPEVHKMIHDLAYQQGSTIQNFVHVLFCEYLGRPDLIGDSRDPSSSPDP